MTCSPRIICVLLLLLIMPHPSSILLILLLCTLHMKMVLVLQGMQRSVTICPTSLVLRLTTGNYQKEWQSSMRITSFERKVQKVRDFSFKRTSKVYAMPNLNYKNLKESYPSDASLLGTSNSSTIKIEVDQGFWFLHLFHVTLVFC